MQREVSGNFPIPLTILTGFLGAGKTTLLNNILHSDHGLRVAVLVNDFGSINIDSQLVVNVDADDAIELSNGCICCTIRGDLLNAMVALTQREVPPEYIIIEASGVSDPLEISMTFRRPELESLIKVDSVLTVIDVEQVRTLDRQNEVLAVLQIGAADIVLVNKIDLVDDTQRESIKTWVRSIIPNVRILETTYGRVPLEMILGVGRFSPERLLNRTSQDIHVHEEGGVLDHHHDHTHDHSMVFSTWSWVSEKPLSLKEVQRAVDKLPSSIYRAKGKLFVEDEPAHQAVLQVVGKRASIEWGEAWGDLTPKSQIVVIGEHGTIDADGFQTIFDACLAENAPKSEFHRLANSAMKWLRGGQKVN